MITHFTIKNRWTETTLYECEADSLKEAIVKAVAERADLQCADLGDANLRGANLRDADLGGAYLRDAYLRDANLRDANLRDAYLYGADLGGADLRGADLHGAKGIKKHFTTPLYSMLYATGTINSFKLVNKHGEGPQYGGIKYEIGKEYNVKDADEDENIDCGAGINLATLDWCCKEWRGEYRILIAEHTKEDIAAIPIGSDGKYRVHRCKIVGEVDLKEVGLKEEELRK